MNYKLRIKKQKSAGFTRTPKFGVTPKGGGFTIIELMIAVSLFLIVMTIGMGSLLNANLLHQKSRDIRSIMDNLSFIMEDMSKNLRTGSNYRCFDDLHLWSQSQAQALELNTPRNCTSGGVIVFEEGHGHTPSTPPPNADPNARDQWGYKIDSPDGIGFNISKSVDGGLTWVQLNPDEVKLKIVSGFSVLGAEPPPDSQQPFIIIKLVGTIKLKNIDTTFSLQTSVSQRQIDI